MIEDLRIEVEKAVNQYFDAKGEGARFWVSTMIASMLGEVSASEVRPILREMASGDEPSLVRTVEVICPKCQDFPVAGVRGREEDVVGRDLLCEDCGEEFEVSIGDTVDVYTKAAGPLYSVYFHRKGEEEDGNCLTHAKSAVEAVRKLFSHDTEAWVASIDYIHAMRVEDEDRRMGFEER